MPKRAVVFDAYGTLFDVTAAVRRAAAADTGPLADRAAELSRLWREKQIGYSWWRTVTGEHVSFWQVTQDALDHALAACGLDGDPPLRDALLTLYWELAAYPEVPEVLAALRAAGRGTAILSNGSPDMLAAAVEAAGLAEALDHVLSVEEVGAFKPDARVYDLVEHHTGLSPAEVLFVSANGWDAAAAAGHGFATVWVNRAAAPPERLPHAPHHEVRDLTAVPGLAAA